MVKGNVVILLLEKQFVFVYSSVQKIRICTKITSEVEVVLVGDQGLNCIVFTPLHLVFQARKNVRLNFSTLSGSKVVKYQGNISQKFGEWELFEKMSNLSHFRRQFWSFQPLSDVTFFIPKNDKICLLKCDKLDIFSKSSHSPNF